MDGFVWTKPDAVHNGVRFKAFRWYLVETPPTLNATRFRTWLLELKAGNPHAIGFFVQLFIDFCADDLNKADLLLPIPPGEVGGAFPIAKVAEESAKRGFGCALTNRLVRISSVAQKEVRLTREQQKQTLGLRQIEGAFDRIILLDDIITTGATMGACVDLLRGVFPGSSQNSVV